MCTIDGCEGVVFARGWCRVHWNRWRRYGDPGPARQIQGDDRARLAQHIDRRGDDECWPWTGSINANGYGRSSVKGRKTYAHRTVYEVFVGPIPDGYDIDHLCRVRECVNPSHLEVVTIGENVRRGAAWRRRGGDAQ